MKMIVMI